MIVHIGRGEVDGTVSAPSSKSYTHRVLLLSALADGESTIVNPLSSDDTVATIRVLEQLGIKIKHGENEWAVIGGNLRCSKSPLYCNESGTTLRFLTAICSLIKGKLIISGGRSLSKRPIQPLVDALRQLRVNCTSNNGFPPVTVESKGGIDGGSIMLPGNISSQFVSAILLVSPLANGGIDVRLTTPLESKPYVSMTLDAMRSYGTMTTVSSDMRNFITRPGKYTATRVNVEGDWSSAAYFLGAGALAGEVTIKRVNSSSYQADKAILDILESQNADIEINQEVVKIRKSDLKGITWDMSDCPDLFPIVSSLCAAANGVSVLTGIRRLRYKESNRVDAMKNCLSSMGVKIQVKEDAVKIIGGNIRGSKIDPYNDHRVAMSIAILSLVAEGETEIHDAECVSKSYPSFWHELETIGVSIRRE